MPVDRVWDDLIPDNTTQQVSPADVRDSLDSVADTVDTVQIQNQRATATDDAGDGSVEGDVNASDFSGNADPDPAPNTFIHVATGTLFTLAHKGAAYAYLGPSGVDVGLGGTYVTTANDWANTGVSNHPALSERDTADSHPQAAVTGLETALADLASWDAAHVGAADPHSQYQLESELLTAVLAVLDYTYNKATDILDIPAAPTWTPLVSVTIVGAAAGTYEVGFSLQGAMADNNDSTHCRYRLDGGTWYELSKEAKDVNDTFGAYYAFPIDLTAGDHTFELEANKTTGGDQFDIYFADAWFERKA